VKTFPHLKGKNKMSSEIKKICNCEKPKITSVPVGFKGTVKCGECGGLLILPFSKDNVEYKGKDEVERFLFNLNRNNNNMTYEKAILITLIEIKKLLSIPPLSINSTLEETEDENMINKKIKGKK